MVTQQPYQYANDSPLEFTDPTGLWGIGSLVHMVVHVTQEATAVVQTGADLVAAGTAAVGLEPVAAVALTVSEAAGSVNTAATCLDAATGGGSTLGDCAVNFATNVATAGFAKLVTPGRVVRDKTVWTAEERLYQSGANLVGDAFSWAYQYRLPVATGDQCPTTPEFRSVP